MVVAVKLIFMTIFYVAVFKLLLGMIRPVYVLWFLDRCNRKKVLKLYGRIALLSFLLWKILESI
jgi:multisubunit Na+/H+ antiporter MnhE subunit